MDFGTLPVLRVPDVDRLRVGGDLQAVAGGAAAVTGLATAVRPYGSDVSDPVGAIVAELAANAVTHGRVPGRDFELRLAIVTGSVRVEVTDTRGGPPYPPAPDAVRPPRPFDEHGRGFVLVDALADRWEVIDREPPGKTVRAEIRLPEWMSEPIAK